MFEDRNTIFFSGFVLGAIFSYSGMMGFFGGCLTGAIVLSQYKLRFKNNIEPKNNIETKNNVETKNNTIDWVEIEKGETISPLENIKTIFGNYIKGDKK
jgi:hypothetical protein